MDPDLIDNTLTNAAVMTNAMDDALATLAPETMAVAGAAAAGLGLLAIMLMVFGVLVGLVCLIACWRIFSKAGLPGWGVLIPIWNFLLLLKASGMAWWWLFLAPIAAFIVPFKLAGQFGKGGGFGVGILLLPLVFLPMLAFGDAAHAGPEAAADSKAPSQGEAEAAEGETATAAGGSARYSPYAAGGAAAAEAAPSGPMGIFLALAIIAALSLGAIVGLQIAEYKYYQNPPNVWPAPIVPTAAVE